MVELVGRTAANDTAVTRIAAPVPIAQSTADTTPAASSGTAQASAQTSGLAAQMAASPPVDTDRVATIKRAIAEGKFPILPATIADRLLALKLQWNPNESPQHD